MLLRLIRLMEAVQVLIHLAPDPDILTKDCHVIYKLPLRDIYKEPVRSVKIH